MKTIRAVLVFLLLPAALSARQPEPPRPRPSRVFSTGQLLQDFTSTDLSGHRIQLQQLKGKIVVLNFWFIQCTPCLREIPELNKLAEDYADTSQVVFLGIALDRKTALDSFLQRTPVQYNIIPSGRPVAALYKIYSYPTHVVLNREGRVIFHSTGYAAGTAYWLRKMIKSVLPQPTTKN
ncbi:MAG TPA: TlpA disulfide reductase family protein [Chitinophagaceae bacterium]|nr:TlpA disulfide reductase family protein [Chitinophagaceae bacterium]